MTGGVPDVGGARSVLPPLPAEDHVCSDCALVYRSVEVPAAIAMIGRVPAATADAVHGIAPRSWRRRPAPEVWSVAGYVCHLRDVFVTSTIRLHRARTEDGPVLEPVLDDLRARRFRYVDADVEAVLVELAAAVAGCCEEAGRLRAADWDRVVTRLPGEERSARWLVRQAAHEGRHHVRDIGRVGAVGVPGERPPDEG